MLGVYPYPICIRHYARTDRTGNRVPISGNIISVMRPTASENVDRYGHRRQRAREFRAIVRAAERRKTPGPPDREGNAGEKRDR